ncbi:hypothetical protein GCM10022409_05070 [Hymenobacter glaciei]|uniref:Uncharacterized protein n=1 Tax=Hymenobacter glaciei TaxID=877209 RepID=A0ABP7TCL2_9BACT
MWRAAGKPPNAAVETRATGAELAPGAQPGLPQMVVMVDTRNGLAAHQRGSSNSTNYSGE